jgi:hypothetical protein
MTKEEILLKLDAVYTELHIIEVMDDESKRLLYRKLQKVKKHYENLLNEV